MQWLSDSSSLNYDKLLEIEELLEEKLSDESEVDGHDIGSEQMNIFIFTDNPLRSVEHVKAILGKHKSWEAIRVAYRETNGNKYTILWPKHLIQFVVS